MSQARKALASVLCLASASAAQLVLPADGQPPYVGSGWMTHDGTSVLAVDLNADGCLDLLHADNELTAALNNGHGVFELLEPTEAVTLMYGVECGDLDGDGDLDAVGCREFNDFVSTFAGDGMGRFTVIESLSVDSANDPALADFDLDGVLDVAVAHKAAGFSHFTLLGLGDGHFGAPVPHGTVACNTIDAADWDLDGDPDVLAAAVTSLRVMLWNAGAFTNGPSTSSGVGGPGRLADIDADGRPDAVNTANGVGGTKTLNYRRNVNGAFATNVQYQVGGTTLAIERDPADGFPDLVAAQSGTFSRIVNGPGGMAQQANIATVHDIDTLDIADMNGDGLADVVAGPVIYFAPASGAMAKPKIFPLPLASSYAWAMALADLDGNAQPDIVLIDRDDPKLIVGKGKNPQQNAGLPFSAWSSFPTDFGSLMDLCVLDVDGDGLDDALVGVGAIVDGLGVHLGDGNLGFGPSLLTPTGLSPKFMAPGDFDADGVPDVAVILAHGVSTPLTTWLGTGSGTFTAGENFGVGLAECVAAGDVDGDGFLDAAFTLSGGGLFVCEGDGTGQLAAPVLVPQAGSANGDLVLADFDADGHLDIAAGRVAGSAVGLLRSDGAGGFDEPVGGGFDGVSTHGLIAADVDDDGALDLAWTGFLDGMLYVARGDGQGGLHSHTAHPASEGGTKRAMAAADFDHDGKTDLLQLGVPDADFALLLRRDDADNAWASIGGGMPGAGGQPRAIGSGDPIAGQVVQLDVDHAAPGVLAYFVLGLDLLGQPFKGGHLVPSPDLLLGVGFTSGVGTLHLPNVWPADAPTGVELWMQIFTVDTAAAHGLAATGGLRLRVP